MISSDCESTVTVPANCRDCKRTAKRYKTGLHLVLKFWRWLAIIRLNICVKKEAGLKKEITEDAGSQQRNVLCAVFLFAGRGTLFLPRVRCGRYCEVRVSSCGLFAANAARRRQVQELMNNIEVDGGEIRPAVTCSPLPTAVALATTGEIVWANDAFAEISGRGTAVSGVRMGEIAPTFETGWLIKGQTAFPGELGIGKRQYHVFGSLVQSGAGQLMMLHLSTAPSLSVCATHGTTVRLSRLSRSTTTRLVKIPLTRKKSTFWRALTNVCLPG